MLQKPRTLLYKVNLPALATILVSEARSVCSSRIAHRRICWRTVDPDPYRGPYPEARTGTHWTLVARVDAVGCNGTTSCETEDEGEVFYARFAQLDLLVL